LVGPITTSSFKEIGLITGRPARSAAMPVLRLLSAPKPGFSPPHGRHIATPVPNFTFIGAEMWEDSPKNCQNLKLKVRTWDTLPAPNFVNITQGDSSLGGKFLPKIRNLRDF